MQCPECKSTHINKNGHKKGKQNYICVSCGRQFIDCYEVTRGYSEEVKGECLKMYVNGLGFRGIERVKNVHHPTIINWVKQRGNLLPDCYMNIRNWRFILLPPCLPLTGVGFLRFG
jgi:transposase-like protein